VQAIDGILVGKRGRVEGKEEVAKRISKRGREDPSTDEERERERVVTKAVEPVIPLVPVFKRSHKRKALQTPAELARGIRPGTVPVVLKAQPVKGKEIERKIAVKKAIGKKESPTSSLSPPLSSSSSSSSSLPLSLSLGTHSNEKIDQNPTLLHSLNLSTDSGDYELLDIEIEREGLAVKSQSWHSQVLSMLGLGSDSGSERERQGFALSATEGIEGESGYRENEGDREEKGSCERQKASRRHLSSPLGSGQG
jgi:hypothetical protein